MLYNGKLVSAIYCNSPDTSTQWDIYAHEEGHYLLVDRLNVNVTLLPSGCQYVGRFNSSMEASATYIQGMLDEGNDLSIVICDEFAPLDPCMSYTNHPTSETSLLCSNS